MSKYHDNVVINDLELYREYSDQISLVYRYLRDTYNINNECVMHIITLVLNENNVKQINSTCDIEKMLYKRYCDNKKIVMRYSRTINYANNIDDMLKLLYKHNSFILFEDITDTVYYSVLWEHIHIN